MACEQRDLQEVVKSPGTGHCGSCPWPASTNQRAGRPLLERRFATGIRCLLDGIDQAVQVDRGLEGRLAAFAVADRPIFDCLGEQRVHLSDVDGFPWRRTGRSEGEALRYRHWRERIVALRAVQEDLAQLR